ncbi:MAG TPA: hypothetical protein VNJ04_10205 [Gemmatimonadaceae bacterium]|nr:hypothetical protein [Gemmatimonadaceae bacterium]
MAGATCLECEKLETLAIASAKSALLRERSKRAEDERREIELAKRRAVEKERLRKLAAATVITPTVTTPTLPVPPPEPKPLLRPFLTRLVIAACVFALAFAISDLKESLTIRNLLPVPVRVSIEGHKAYVITPHGSLDTPVSVWRDVSLEWQVEFSRTSTGKPVGEFIGGYGRVKESAVKEAKEKHNQLLINLKVAPGMRVIAPRITNNSPDDVRVAVKVLGEGERDCRCVVPRNARKLGIGAYLVPLRGVSLSVRLLNGRILRVIPVVSGQETPHYIVGDRAEGGRSRQGRRNAR